VKTQTVTKLYRINPHQNQLTLTSTLFVKRHLEVEKF